MSEQTIHAWGFVGNDPHDMTVTLVPGSVAETTNDLLEHIRDHEHMEPTDMKSTRTLDGWLVSVSFRVQTRPDYVMWHAIQTTREPWPVRAAATEPDPPQHETTSAPNEESTL